MRSDAMKEIEARLRADAPAWREAVARGATGARRSAGMGAEASGPGARWLLAAGLAGAVLGAGVWVQVQRNSSGGEARVVEVPAVPTLGDLAVTRWEEPYRAEVERVTQDVRRAVEFVVSVWPGELMGEAAGGEGAEKTHGPEAVGVRGWGDA